MEKKLTKAEMKELMPTITGVISVEVIANRIADRWERMYKQPSQQSNQPSEKTNKSQSIQTK